MKDGVGQIHFAARKAFTHGYDGADTYEDKTIFCNAGDFTFAWYETGSDYSISGLTAVDDDIENKATNTIKFPTLSFYTDASKAGSDTDHLVLDGETKDFYYKVVETSSNVATVNGKNVSKTVSCLIRFLPRQDSAMRIILYIRRILMYLCLASNSLLVLSST